MSSREMVHAEWTRESTPEKTFETAGKWVEKAIEDDRPWFTFTIDDEGNIAATGNWPDTEAYQEFIGQGHRVLRHGADCERDGRELGPTQ